MPGLPPFPRRQRVARDLLLVALPLAVATAPVLLSPAAATGGAHPTMAYPLAVAQDIGTTDTPAPDTTGATDSPTATPSATPSPTATDSPTATATPSPTRTATPSPSPSATPTPSIVPPVGIPVATAYPTPAHVASTRGRDATPSGAYLVGAYYFSGWSHGQNDNLSPLLMNSPLRRYEPLIGWYDDTQHQVDKSIDQAANAGLGFFAFDWYDLAHDHYATDQTLNDGLGFYLTSRERKRLKFCITFVNQAPFVPSAHDWPGVVQKWLRYFLQPDYVRVDGKPLLIIFSPEDMRIAFGGSANVHQALDYLRAQARRHGLPGVTIAVGATVTPHGNPWNYGRIAAEGYDFTTGYNYHAAGGEAYRAPVPYSRLVSENESMWQRVATHLPQPYIPVITLGWDQRFDLRGQHTAIIYTGRTPAQFACYAAAARRWVDRHPTRTTRERLVLVYAWNEIGEGGALIPNRTDGYAYANVIRQIFGAPGQAPGPPPSC